MYSPRKWIVPPMRLSVARISANTRRSVTAVGCACLGVVLAAANAQSQVNIVTGQYDVGRTSANLTETVLTTSNVNPNQFGLVFSRQVDGFIFAQPLYLSGLTIQGTTRNVVFVATMNNSVYAFDADIAQNQTPLWQVNLGPTAPLASSPLFYTNMGILSTPVIDPLSGTLYAVALTLQNGVKTFQLHALDVTSGQEKFGGPVTIQAQVNGSAVDSVGGLLSFNPAIQWQRPALLLNSGVLFIAFGTGTRETDTYHGWLLGYDAATLQQTLAYCSSANGTGGGIWMSGIGPAADDGGVYFATGNGTVGNGNDGESVVRLGAAMDSFVPYDYDTLTTNDWDLGSSGVILIPGTNLLVAGGKTGTFYVLNRSNLGGLQPGNAQIVQSFQASLGCFGPHICSVIPHPSFWSRVNAPSLLYAWAAGDILKSFSMSAGGIFNTVPFGQRNTPAAWPGGILALSSNGEVAGSAILWATVPDSSAKLGVVSGTLYALDAVTLTELWDSGMNASDALGNFAKYATITAVNGKVYAPTSSGRLAAYGLRALSTSALTFGNQIIGSTSAPQAVTLTNPAPALLSIDAITASGDFAQTNTCGPSLAPGASCTISVTLTPSTIGTINGTLTIASSSPDNPQTIPLTGTGAPILAPAVSLSAASLFFASQLAGSSSPAQTVTLNNTGTASLVLTISMSGNFTESDNCGTSVAAGASCTISVTFTPAAAGTRTGTVSIANNAAGSPQTITLMGTGLANAVPYILGISPASALLGGSGFTLTVKGTGFLPGTMLKWNGGVRPATLISSTQLQVGIDPSDIATAETAVVSVLNPGPGGGASNLIPLHVTSATPSISLSRSAAGVGTGPPALAVGDLNGDGRVDVEVTNRGDNTVSVLLSNGDGTLQTHADYGTGQGPVALALGDFNGDGKPDLVVVSQVDGTVSILLGNGDGTLQTHADYAVGQSPSSVTVGDFDGDGKLDVAVANTGGNAISVLLGNGDGSFQSHTDYAVGQSPVSLAVGDFNGDGKLDLVVINQADNTASVLLGNGDGSFQTHVDFATGLSPVSLVVCDLNDDDKPDLAIANSGANTVSIMLGSGDGTFQAPVDYPTGQSPVSVVAGDFNGDGDLDLAIANQGDGTLSIFLSEGDGILLPRLDLAATTTPAALAAADFNGDGRLDVVIGSTGSTAVSVMLQSAAVSLSAASLPFGSQTVGTPAPSQTVTLSNTGSATLHIIGIIASGDFAQTSTCGPTLAAGAACTIGITFTPTASGTRNGTVTITDNAIDTPEVVNLTGAGVSLASLTLSPNVIAGGLQTAANGISLSGSSPAGGAIVTLSSSNPAVVPLPANVTVAAGATALSNFTIATNPVSTPTTVSISASYGAITKKANLTVYPPLPYLLNFVPTTVNGGSATTGNQVFLWGKAPAGGVVVNLTSANPAIASVPASVTVPAGSSASPVFTINTKGVSGLTTVSISAACNGSTKSANLSVVPATPSALNLSPKALVGGTTGTANTVSLLGQAPTSGTVVSLTSSNPAIAAVPVSVTVSAGASLSPSFTITTASVSSQTVVTISATSGGVTKSANLTVAPAGIYVLNLSAATVTGGKPVSTNRVGVNGPAPPGGMVITLSSSNPAIASVPASITIPAGTTYSAGFTITTKAVASSTPVTITGTYAGVSKTAVLTVTP